MTICVPVMQRSATQMGRDFIASQTHPLKPARLTGSSVHARQRLSTDSIGSAVVTFSGIQAGSEIRVFLPDNTEIAGVESCDANHVLSWGAYSAGSANNNVTVRVVNILYRMLEFQYTSSVGAQQLPIQQRRDRWYSNPA